MIQCPTCNTENPKTAKFCNECGERLGKPIDSRHVAKTHDGAIAQGDKAKAVGAGGILIEGNVYLGPVTRDPQKALAIYRRVLASTTASLPLRGVDVGASDPTVAQKPVGLSNVYVALDTTTIVEEMKSARTKVTEGVKIVSGRLVDKRISALEATITNRRLVLLGDPGSGKSTFVNFLAYCLAAHSLEPDAGWLKHLPGWREKEADCLPLIMILRDFARRLPKKLPEQAEPRHVLDFILVRLKEQNLSFVSKPIAQLLEDGQVLLLFDGLDEVPTVKQRRFVRDAVNAFIQRYPRCRCLVTCRVLSYQPRRTRDELDLRLTSMPQFELASFDEDKIDRFIKAWYIELARLGSISQEDAPTLSGYLQQAVRRPDLWRLASNPLLLTVMALVHTHKGRLPDARALLYEDTVDILLWRWEQLKASGSESIPRLRQLLLEAGRSDVDLKRVLWELAYTAHAKASEEGDYEKLVDIDELRLEKALAALHHGSRDWAMQVVDTMKLRAGLLLERAPGVFTFPHRTFQEYLAGAHLASLGNFAALGYKLACQESLWREAILLAAGKLVYLHGDLDKPLALVGELCPAYIDEADNLAWRNAWLAGDVLQEIGLQRVSDSRLGCDLLERVRLRLADLLCKGKLAPIERARVGRTLAMLGDPRFDPNDWYLPKEDTLGFIYIPAGKYIMGSDPQIDKQAKDNEQPQHELDLPDFWIARYPVTVVQFRTFTEDSGYNFGFWQYNTVANHPIVMITWHEALMYCVWLTEKLKEIGEKRLKEKETGEKRIGDMGFWEGLASEKLIVTLPSEAEWEKAARGMRGRIYPWGTEFDADKANTSETGISDTSPVGCFPSGASPYGVLDMSGNVWDWTRSKFGRVQNGGITNIYGYPYQLDDDRESLTTPQEFAIVLRGGSFYGFDRHARCANRRGDDPGFRGGLFGFRVVAVSASYFPL